MSLLENGYGLVALVLAAGLAIAVLTLVLGTIERLTARGGRLDDALIDDADRTTDPAEAERLLRQALMIRERDFGRAHPKTARCRLLLSRRVVGTLVVAVQSHLARGRKDEARRILAEALAAEEAIAYEGPETMGLLKQLAFVTK